MPGKHRLNHLIFWKPHRLSMVAGENEKMPPHRAALHININTDIFKHHTRLHKRKLLLIGRGWLSSLLTRKRYLILTALVLFMTLHFFSSFSLYSSLTKPAESLDLLAGARPQEGRGQATAILLNWARLENMRIIVKHLCQYDMFKTIVIWNNNQNVRLESKLFEESCPGRVSIFNSPGNMHFVARYMACAAASTPYCYFQDDDWIIRHLRSMYANFLRFPQFVHTDTNADVYSLTNWKWCFYNDGVSLHTCFSWVGTGAFVARDKVVQFLKMTSTTGMDPTEFAYADMYFTTFMNQPPYQLENELLELPQENAFSAGEGRIRNKIYMHKALEHIFSHLHNKTGLFEAEELAPTLYQRDVRSPCHHDRCLFLTNKHSFPNVRVLRYLPHINITENEDTHENLFKTSPFISNPYSHAVDGGDWTAWKSQKDISAGDYIGLDLLLPLPLPATFRLLIGHEKAYFSALMIHISYDGSEWIPLNPPPRVLCQESSITDGDIRPLDCTFFVPDTGYRFIRLLSTQSWKHPYRVYDFSFKGNLQEG
ncbi:uncharacterized protein VTP21DRAFT_478 [Calcarisporiella thermophila]|uniref:uncharacterized protein n=1 Tax=Calcarisporiella thermophila TaxID=911321 RepID=UPI003744AFB1